jgi:hypothetical protein
MPYLRLIIPIFCIVIFCFANPVYTFAQTEKEIQETSLKIKIAHKELVNSYSTYSDSTLSPETVSSIEALKQSIEKLVKAFVHELPINIPLNTHDIKLDLNKLAQTTKKEKQNINFKVQISSGNLLQILNKFDIPCGNDSILLLFQPSEDKWKHVLTWESPRYEEINGSLNNFEYAVSTPDNDGKWYVVGTDSPARCSSCWGTQRFYVMEPTKEKVNPNILFQKTETSYQCDKGPTLKTTQEGFKISFLGKSVDSDILTRTHIHNYKVNDKQIERIQPIAMDPRDFVDEWINTEWEKASQWTTDSVKIKQIHSTLQGQVNYYFGTIQTQKKSINTITKVELRNDSDSENDKAWNFLVQHENDGNYKLIKIIEED